MKILVLVKQVPDTEEERRLDPVTGLLDRDAGENVVDEINERALEVALLYKDVHKGTHVTVLSMGPGHAVKALRKTLSMGADSAILVADEQLAGADAAQTAAVLVAVARNNAYDLIVAGNKSTDGSTGVVPAMVAEHLGLPLLGSLDSIEIGENTVKGECSGEGQVLSLSASLPAVVSASERAAEARYPNFKGIMMAKRKPLSTLSLEDLGLDLESLAGAARTVVHSTMERPARTAGKKIVDQGSAGVELAEFLVDRRLI